MKQQLGLGLYSVITCTGEFLWRFNKNNTKREYTALQ